MKKIVLSLLCCLFALSSCTSDVTDIPVSSNDLIDQNVVYKSETVKVDVEDVEAPKNDLSKVVVVNETKPAEKMEVIVPAPATKDETVDFVDAYYISKNPEEVEFEMAVAQAESRRGIKHIYVPAPRKVEEKQPVKSEVKSDAKRKFDAKIFEPVRSITFLSTVIYHSNTKADISAKDMTALKNVAKLAIKKDAIIRVVGNASSRSKDMKEIQNKIENFDLSLLRAQKVRDALIRFGVAKDKVFISAVADTEKVVEENMPINEAINRRTEIYLNY